MSNTTPSVKPAAKANGSPDTADLADQIEQIKQEIAVLTEMFGDLAKSQGAQLRDKASDLADKAQGAGRQLLRGARGQANAIEDELTRQLRERPLTSIAMAAAMGYLVGMMSRR